MGCLEGGEDLRCHFIQRVEYEAIPPHGYGHSVVAECETVGTDEEAFGLREEPDAEDEEEVDEVAHVGEEVVVAYGVVFVPSHGHEVSIEECQRSCCNLFSLLPRHSRDLYRIPVMKVLRPSTN